MACALTLPLSTNNEQTRKSCKQSKHCKRARSSSSNTMLAARPASKLAQAHVLDLKAAAVRDPQTGLEGGQAAGPAAPAHAGQRYETGCA